MESNKNRLVFHFYVPTEWKKLKSVRLHLNCLRHYSHIFNEALFVISVDDVTNDNLIIEFEQELIDCGFLNVQFKVKKNNYLYETDTIVEEIVNKLSELDGLTCFGHSKGVGNELSKSIGYRELYEWVCGLYYQTLEYEAEKNNCLYNDVEITFGPYKTYYENLRNKYHWIYSGTFFWINTQKLYDKMLLENIKMRKPSDRFFSEMFLGDLFSSLIPEGKSGESCATSHNCAYLTNADRYYDDVVLYTKLISTEEEYEKFSNFREKMTEGI